MVHSAAWSAPWLVELINHLWQSSVFAMGAWLLTFALRRNQARTRYRLWMLASAKFLIPFSILIAAGQGLQWRTETHVAQPAYSTVIGELAEPFSMSALPPPATSVTSRPASPATALSVVRHDQDWLPFLLVALWGCGALFLLTRWGKSWWQLHVAVRTASPLMFVDEVCVLSTPMRLEPGVFGIVRPVLLLPQGITERLSSAQLNAIFAHELLHVRRRDNLTAALHMVVEILFWFCPVVWWIRGRLMDERERACDEAVLDSNHEPLVYAEGILNVCKFYMEAPMSCISGVAGSDVRKRVARIMSHPMMRKLDVSRKLMLILAGVLAVGMPITFGFVRAAEGQAQVAQKTGIDDTWQGTLHTPQKDLRIVVKITEANPGGLKVVDYSIDQGGQPLPATSASFEGGVFKYAIEFIEGSYEGKMSADGKSIVGTWKQGPNPLPLVLERATPETAWAIPAPLPKIPPMAASADPSFEVATIKPSKPGQQGKGFGFRGRQLMTFNTNLNDLIAIAYGLHAKQIVGAPDWFGTELYDVAGVPDVPGRPNQKQSESMLQKLLADRFQLKFHHEQKVLSVYVITVAHGGPKIKKSTAGADDGQGFMFRGLGDLIVRNMTMADFANGMQAAVVDQPVVDQTGLTDRYDFILKWTPDESQFAQFRGTGVKMPTATNDPNAPPGLYTAIQEQLGLKLEATKAPDDVIVIDHVEKPSAN